MVSQRDQIASSQTLSSLRNGALVLRQPLGLGNEHLVGHLPYLGRIADGCGERIQQHGLTQQEIVAVHRFRGVQEEGVTFNTPVLVAREDTERPEGLASGLLHLVGSRREDILRLGQQFIDNSSGIAKSLNLESNPFGDGRASERIAMAVREFLGE